MKKNVFKVFYLVLFFCLICNIKVYGFSYKITSDTYDENCKKASLWVENSNKVKRTYKIYKQTTISDDYIKKHGCGSCCLTTILHAYGKHKSKNPSVIHKVVEKEILSIDYSKSSKPLGLKGMWKVLNQNGIEATYNSREDSKSKIKQELKKHLQKGKPAVILLKKNATYYASSKVKGYHYVLLLGYISDGNNAGKVVVGDSSGSYSRIHLESLSNLVNCMVRGNEERKGYYFTKTGGGILKIY